MGKLPDGPPGLWETSRGCGSYVFEAPIKDLQLPLGEVRLGLQLLQALRPMANHGHLQLIFDLIWNQRRWHWDADLGGHLSDHSRGCLKGGVVIWDTGSWTGITLQMTFLPGSPAQSLSVSPSVQPLLQVRELQCWREAGSKWSRAQRC